MDILMPQLGETVAEGKITTWFKSIGDAVKPGDNLFEIETDKVSMEVPATSGGTLTEIRVVAGEVAPVGAVVAIVAGAGGEGAGGGQRLSPPRAGRRTQGALVRRAPLPPPHPPPQAGEGVMPPHLP
jgi:pyruvate dehydrogenase E2 component (dihydrolipoamide acetyltransferase)